jgi:hypothetical protein
VTRHKYARLRRRCVTIAQRLLQLHVLRRAALGVDRLQRDSWSQASDDDGALPSHARPRRICRGTRPGDKLCRACRHDGARRRKRKGRRAGLARHGQTAGARPIENCGDDHAFRFSVGECQLSAVRRSIGIRKGKGRAGRNQEGSTAGAPVYGAVNRARSMSEGGPGEAHARRPASGVVKGHRLALLLLLSSASSRRMTSVWLMMSQSSLLLIESIRSARLHVSAGESPMRGTGALFGPGLTTDPPSQSRLRLDTAQAWLTARVSLCAPRLGQVFSTGGAR